MRKFKYLFVSLLLLLYIASLFSGCMGDTSQSETESGSSDTVDDNSTEATTEASG